MRFMVGIGVSIGTACLVAAFGCGRPAQETPLPPRALAPEDVTIRLQGIASVMTGVVEPAVAHQPGAVPPFHGAPPHLRFHFDNDSLASEVDYCERQVLVYPLDTYRAMFTGVEQDSFDARIDRFRTLLQTKPSRPTEPILVLPAVGREPAFQARIRFLVFQGGHGEGVRFLSYREHPKYPTIKRGLFYTFQGIADHRYVSFFWPVAIEDLPERRGAANTIDYIGGLTDEEMAPALQRLDQAVQSLLIQEPAPSNGPS